MKQGCNQDANELQKNAGMASGLHSAKTNIEKKMKVKQFGTTLSLRVEEKSYKAAFILGTCTCFTCNPVGSNQNAGCFAELTYHWTQHNLQSEVKLSHKACGSRVKVYACFYALKTVPTHVFKALNEIYVCIYRVVQE